MADATIPEEGDTRSYTRTFTNEEVRAFADLSKDEGYHHVVEDGDGTLVVHGLLTATLPTKLGGELNFVARTMDFEFPRPVFTGQAITCEATTESVDPRDGRYDVQFSFECTNESGDVVLRGESEGVVFEGGAPV